MFAINYIAVLVAAVVAFIIGFLMHGPVAGKLWMRLANIHPTGNEKFSDMYGKMFWNLVVNIVTAAALNVVYLLASTSPLVGGSSLMVGILSAIIIWLGFLVTSSSIEVIWMGRSKKLWLFEVFSSLLVMLSMGIVIALV
jgi:hypothetical protein